MFPGMCCSKKMLLFVLLISLSGCGKQDAQSIEWPVSDKVTPLTFRLADPHHLEMVFRRVGMVDVQTLDSSIRVHLRYGTTDNFMQTDFYEGFNKGYLQPEVAKMLVEASAELKRMHPHLRLLVWDAARPRSVQQKMWDAVVPPPGVFKGLFVSNPSYGSLHNYGCAVDVTIFDIMLNRELDMGSDLDHFGPEAWPVEEARLLKNGKLTGEQVTNRRLLRSVMYHAGFWNIQTEWWHFNAMRREVARAKYRMIP
jgi:zinc D-Ala-D-Ala dipeptidase